MLLSIRQLLDVGFNIGLPCWAVPTCLLASSFQAQHQSASIEVREARQRRRRERLWGAETVEKDKASAVPRAHVRVGSYPYMGANKERLPGGHVESMGQGKHVNKRATRVGSAGPPTTPFTIPTTGMGLLPVVRLWEKQGATGPPSHQRGKPHEQALWGGGAAAAARAWEPKRPGELVTLNRGCRVFR